MDPIKPTYGYFPIDVGSTRRLMEENRSALPRPHVGYVWQRIGLDLVAIDVSLWINETVDSRGDFPKLDVDQKQSSYDDTYSKQYDFSSVDENDMHSFKSAPGGSRGGPYTLGQSAP